MTELNLFIPITKVDAAKRLVYGVLTEEVPDKAGEIFDYETGKEAFKAWSGEIEKASGGKSKGNLRAMHDKVAAGKFTDIVFDDDAKRIEGVAKVVDDNEWEKVESGVYSGFSIGGGYAKRWTDPNNPQLKRYTPRLSEVSLVDNPCVPSATFEFIKADGSTELRKFTAKQEDIMTKTTETKPDTGAAPDAIEKAAPADTSTDTSAADTAESEAPVEKAERPQDKGGVVQGFQSRDGSFHLKKADALKRNSELDAEDVAAPALDALQKLADAVAKAEAPADEAPAEEVAKADTGSEPAPSDAPAAESVEKAEAPAAQPATAAPEMKKGMYGVARFADLLSSIKCLQQDTAWEAEYEGDDSEMPAKIKAWLAEGGTLLVQMATEETAELTTDKAAGTGELAKRDDALTAENTALKKAFGEMTPKLESLLQKFEEQSQRIAHLESQPAAPKGALRAVEKANDGGHVSDGDIVTKFNQHLDGLSADAKSKLLMKFALANPVSVTQ